MDSQECACESPGLWLSWSVSEPALSVSVQCDSVGERVPDWASPEPVAYSLSCGNQLLS